MVNMQKKMHKIIVQVPYSEYFNISICKVCRICHDVTSAYSSFHSFLPYSAHFQIYGEICPFVRCKALMSSLEIFENQEEWSCDLLVLLIISALGRSRHSVQVHELY